MRKEYLLIGAAAAIAVASSAGAALTVSAVNGSLFNLNGTLASLNTPENPFGAYDIVAAEAVASSPNAFLIGDAADLTDNVVNFDGLAENIQRHLGLGAVVGSVNESFVVNANGSQTINISMTSVGGGDLFVGGFSDNSLVPVALTQAVFFIGALGNVVDSSPAFGAVVSAQLDMLNAAGSVFAGVGGIDVTAIVASPWAGFVGIGINGGVGIGINTVNFTITVGKVPAPGAFALFGIAGLAATRRRREI